MRTKVLLIVVAALLLSLPGWANVMFTLQPSGSVSGAPGSTVGWGYTLTNSDASDWLVLTSSNFMPSTSLGTYMDFTQFNFIVLGPSPESSSLTQSFNPMSQTGIGSFTISGSATPGDSAMGNIVITYDLFNQDPNDPNFDPDRSLITPDNRLSAAATVNAAGTATVPEPTSLVLLGTCLLAAGRKLVGRSRTQTRSS